MKDDLAVVNLMARFRREVEECLVRPMIGMYEGDDALFKKRQPPVDQGMDLRTSLQQAGLERILTANEMPPSQEPDVIITSFSDSNDVSLEEFILTIGKKSPAVPYIILKTESVESAVHCTSVGEHHTLLVTCSSDNNAAIAEAIIEPAEVPAKYLNVGSLFS